MFLLSDRIIALIISLASSLFGKNARVIFDLDLSFNYKKLESLQRLPPSLLRAFSLQKIGKIRGTLTQNDTFVMTGTLHHCYQDV